jgi:hypothetical protein
MKNPTVVLTIASLLSILLASFHLSDDIVLGIEPGGVSNYNGILILASCLFATLMLEGRRWAHAIVLLVSLGAAAVPYLHMTGVGLVGGRIAGADGKFFWVWTLMALGVTAIISSILSAHGLWRLQRRRSASASVTA